MSTSDLYILNKKSTTHLAEFQNGWGSAMRCWQHLYERYIGDSFSLTESKEVWALDSELKGYEKVALLMTFDRSYVPLPCLEEAGEACFRFGEDCASPVYVNHWPAIGNTLIEAATMKFNRHARGVALSCTSVADNWCDPATGWVDEAWSIFKECT